MLVGESVLKMIKFSSSLKLNEIHIVDSPFNEDPKNIIFSREVLISGEGRSENIRKWAITGTSIVMQIGGGEFRESISTPSAHSKFWGVVRVGGQGWG